MGDRTEITAASHPIAFLFLPTSQIQPVAHWVLSPSTSKVQFLSCLVLNSRQLQCPWSYSRTPHSMCKECNSSLCGKAAPLSVGLVQLRVCVDISVIHNYPSCSSSIPQSCASQNAPTYSILRNTLCQTALGLPDCRIMELLKLEVPSEVMESNCSSSTVKATTNSCPQVPHPHVLLIPLGMGTLPHPWAACVRAGQFFALRNFPQYPTYTSLGTT